MEIRFWYEAQLLYIKNYRQREKPNRQTASEIQQRENSKRLDESKANNSAPLMSGLTLTLNYYRHHSYLGTQALKIN